MLQAFFEDGGYRKTFVAEVEAILDLKVDILPKIKAVGNSRRLNKDLVHHKRLSLKFHTFTHFSNVCEYTF